MEILSYQEFVEVFKQRMEETIPEQFDGCGIRVFEAPKNNRMLDMLTLDPKNSGDIHIFPAIRLQDAYTTYRTHGEYGDPMEDTVNNVWDIIGSTYREAPHTADFSWKDARANIIPCMVNREANAELLKHAPHQDLLDMAVVCRWVNVLDIGDDQTSSVVITDGFLDFLHTPEEDRARLFDIAKENAAKSSPVEIVSMGELLQRMGLMSADPLTVDLYIISNKQHQYGASALLDKDVLDQVYALYGGPFYILPSSIHELITVSQEDMGDRASVLAQMVCDVNRDQVAVEERLSDSVYYYDGKELSIAENVNLTQDTCDVDIEEDR